MSNEIQASLVVTVANGAFKDQFAPGSLAIDQAAIGAGGYTQKIGFAADEVVNFGDISVNGWCRLRNLDAAHYVVYGPESGGAMVAFGKLKPGEFAWLRIAPTVVMRAQADTAEVLLDVRIYQD